MRRSTAGYVVSVFVVGIVIGVLGTYESVVGPQTQRSDLKAIPSESCGGLSITTCQYSAIPTTLEAIKGGSYITARNKFGYNGTLVYVSHVLVTGYLYSTEDGDFHVFVSDNTTRRFVTEIPPALRVITGVPAKDTYASMWGFAYCDRNHANATWHGNTCWEIHPVIAWQYSVGQSSVTFTETKLSTTNQG